MKGGHKMANTKYQIWNKTSHVYTPVGEDLTHAQWIERYQWINNPVAVPVVAAGMFNGGFIGELSQMKLICESQGAEFPSGLTNEELLDAIAAFEDEMNTPDPDYVTPEERQAAALEAIAMENMPDVNE